MTETHDAAKVRIFPPAVPLLTVLLGVALQWLMPIELAAKPSLGLRLAFGGTVVAAAILGLGLWAVSLVRRSGQSENPWKPTTEIIVRGPFRFTRNPMYLQMVLVCVGFSILLWNVWVLLLTPACVWALTHLVIKPEEAYLERKFGETYLDYKRRVRRWL
jgi:protein-S-isoprenylcysteine O-methyltransferase Ste14